MKPTERFSNLANIYARGRPGYSDQAIDFIINHCQLRNNALLVDIGCGTGISSRAFSRRGLRVIGIEPNDNMRQQAELANETLDYDLPEYRSGSAESTGLPGEYADAVMAAQSFHWFDPDKSLFEFKCILKPGGWVILLWNERDESDLFTRDYGELIKQYCNTSPVESDRAKAGNKLLESPLYTHKEKLTFTNEQLLDEQGLLDRAFSISYAPKETKERDKFARKLKDLFSQNQKDGIVTLKYNLDLYVASRL